MAALLNPAALARLESLELRARSVVEGALAGMHRSPHHGAAVEFAEHKEYSAGDEIKHIDWKAYGKLDKYYVKRFEEETELRAYLLVDVSASMGYRGAGPSKLEYASMLSASLGYLLLEQKDQVGVIAFSDSLRGYLPPRGRRGHLFDLLTTLEGLAPSGRTDIARACTYLTEVARRRSLVVVLSDLLEEGRQGPSEVGHLLRGLRARRHDVVVFHLLDHDELTLPFERTAWFESMEGGGRVLAEPEEVRRAYLAEMAGFIAGYRKSLGEGDVEYHLVDTSTPPATVLIEFLDGVARRSRRS